MTLPVAAQQAVDIMRQIATQAEKLKRRPDVMTTMREALEHAADDLAAALKAGG